MILRLIDIHKPVKIKEVIIDKDETTFCYHYTFGETIGFEVTGDAFKLTVNYIVKTMTGEILTVDSSMVIPINERNN